MPDRRGYDHARRLVAQTLVVQNESVCIGRLEPRDKPVTLTPMSMCACKYTCQWHHTASSHAPAIARDNCSDNCCAAFLAASLSSQQASPVDVLTASFVRPGLSVLELSLKQVSAIHLTAYCRMLPQSMSAQGLQRSKTSWHGACSCDAISQRLRAKKSAAGGPSPRRRLITHLEDRPVLQIQQ